MPRRFFFITNWRRAWMLHREMDSGEEITYDDNVVYDQWEVEQDLLHRIRMGQTITRAELNRDEK